jgi:hypothetical protein
MEHRGAPFPFGRVQWRGRVVTLVEQSAIYISQGAAITTLHDPATGRTFASFRRMHTAGEILAVQFRAVEEKTRDVAITENGEHNPMNVKIIGPIHLNTVAALRRKLGVKSPLAKGRLWYEVHGD